MFVSQHDAIESPRYGSTARLGTGYGQQVVVVLSFVFCLFDETNAFSTNGNLAFPLTTQTERACPKKKTPGCEQPGVVSLRLLYVDLLLWILCSVADVAQFFSKSDANAVPTRVTASRVDFADCVLARRVVATRRVVDGAAVGLLALLCGCIGTELVPLNVAAERILRTDQLAAVRIVTTRRAVGCEAITSAFAANHGAVHLITRGVHALERAALIAALYCSQPIRAGAIFEAAGARHLADFALGEGCLSAEAVPRNLAAERISCADRIAALRVITTDGAVVRAAVASTFTTDNRAVD